MSTRLLVVGLGGSTHPTSSSQAALELALRGAQQEGAATELLALNGLDLPLYDHRQALDGPHAPDVTRLIETCARADAMIWSSPLYHGSVSAVFKNAIDWLELLHDHEQPYLAGRAIGLTASSGGAQAMQAINAMEYMVRALRGVTVPFVMPVTRSRKVFGADGVPQDSKTGDRLLRLGRETVELARLLRP